MVQAIKEEGVTRRDSTKAVRWVFIDMYVCLTEQSKQHVEFANPLVNYLRCGVVKRIRFDEDTIKHSFKNLTFRNFPAIRYTTLLRAHTQSTLCTHYTHTQYW